MRRMLLLGFVAAVLLVPFGGCKHCTPGTNPQPGPCAPSGPPGPGFVPPPSPLPKGPQWLPDSPGQPPPPAPIGSLSKSVDPFDYQKDLTWKAGTGTGPGPSVRLYPPEVTENPNADGKVQLYPPEGSSTDKPLPPKVEEGSPAKDTAGLPLGISKFVQVRDKVANGLRPSLDDGLDWLQARGYKTVLFLHEPGVSENADRKQVEKRGLKFVTLEVSPLTLSQKTVDDFNRMVGDTAGLPLFVYDRDGALTGSLWYLHFRLIDQASDDAARAQARSLGLHEDGDGAHRDMWQAAQKFWSETKR